MKPLTANVLDKMGCENPHCQHQDEEHEVYLHQRCCPGAGLEACYSKGVLVISCAHCHENIIAIAVAREAA